MNFDKKNEQHAKEYIKKGIFHVSYHNVVFCNYCNYIPISVEDYKEHLITRHGVLHVQEIKEKSNKVRK